MSWMFGFLVGFSAMGLICIFMLERSEKLLHDIANYFEKEIEEEKTKKETT